MTIGEARRPPSFPPSISFNQYPLVFVPSVFGRVSLLWQIVVHMLPSMYSLGLRASAQRRELQILKKDQMDREQKHSPPPLTRLAFDP